VKALVVGAGSIGLRHGRILDDLGLAVSYVSKRTDLQAQIFGSVADALTEWGPDYVVVASETTRHRDALRELARARFEGSLLIEKPVFDRSPSVTVDPSLRSARVGYNLRFHPGVAAVRQLVSGWDLSAATLYCGSFLPSWRPDSDYRSGYSAKRSGGGGVLRDVSHELDLALWLFGPVLRVVASGGTLGNLGIETEDAVSVLIETENCPLVTVHLNYLERVPGRSIRISGQGDSLVLDLLTSVLKTSAGEESFEVERDDTYRDQHLDVLGPGAVSCSLEEGLGVVRLIEAIEESMASQRWVEVAP
jgi:predicted dehydrogenase